MSGDTPSHTIVKVYRVVLGKFPDEGHVTVIIKGRPIQFHRTELTYVAEPGIDAPYSDIAETL